MLHKSLVRLFSLLVGLCFLFSQHTVAATQKQEPGTIFGPRVDRSIKNDATIPLRKMKPMPIKQEQENEEREIKNRVLPKALLSIGKSGRANSSVVNLPAIKAMPSAFESFEGTGNLCECLPPDTNGDVGPNHYVQVVNVHIQVFDKSGNSLLGPEPISTLWQGFGGACESQDDGDPIALYDQLADRWLVSQFALFAPDGHNHQCVAISQSGDPTGSYYRYDFDLGDLVNDYPHFGVWADGYYMSVNQFTPGFDWAGAGAYAFERDKMLLGQPARKIYFDLSTVDSSFGGMLPSDLDGGAPAASSPNVFAEIDDDAFGSPSDQLSLWDFHVDWVNTANSTFGLSGFPSATLSTDAFDSNLCNYSRSCIPQPGTDQGLDAISDRLMHRLQFRTLNGVSYIVGNHTVDADGTDHAGIHWFQLQNSGSGWGISNQGIYAPDSDNRWMGSAAMDSFGNIALGYSVSSSSTYPSIRYAGRLSSDPAGQLSQGESTIIAGSGNQTHGAARWGDYSGLSVDPSPGNYGGLDCDFWYTTEYIQTSGVANWQTRVGAFSFSPAGCGGPHGDVIGTITDSASGLPISGATVKLQPGGFSTTTDANGQYHFALAVGSYDLTASAYGYFSQTHNAIPILDGSITTEDFALAPAPHVFVSGAVKDGSGHGWPLYARIDIDGYPYGPIFTNPSTGIYSVELIQDTPFTFSVRAFDPGYSTEVRPVTPPAGGSTENFNLTVNPVTCNALGYGFQGGLFQDFNGGVLPAGWKVVDRKGNGQVWAFVDPEGVPNNTGADGLFAVINSDYYGDSSQNTELRSPSFDFSGQSTVHLQFDSDFYYFDGELGDVDVSPDGGSTWINVLRYQGNVRGPHHEDLDISSIAGNHSRVMVRFHYYKAHFAWWWQVDNVRLGASCVALPGGLIVGNVYDGNTNLGLNNATVVNDNAAAENTRTVPTPSDPNLADGFFIVYSTSIGPNSFTASKSAYGSDTETVNVALHQVTSQDFHLTAGMLIPDPLLLEDTVAMGNTDNLSFTLQNTGNVAADFEILEGNGNTASPQFAGSRARHESPDGASAVNPHANARTTRDLNLTHSRHSKPYPNAAGDVIQSWSPGDSFSWGIAVDTETTDIWVDSPAINWYGDDLFSAYQPDGTATGASWPHSWGAFNGPADAAFNSNTGMLWIMDVGQDNCIHEIDPAAGVTGNTICPAWDVSQRGLAYDPQTDTYYAGGWNEYTIYHFDSTGAILDQTNVDLAISGLAYNPDTQHLFVMVNDSPNLIHVLDAANGYADLGSIAVSDFNDYDGAGMEIDCDGSLWAVNQGQNKVYQIDSGESTSICVRDLPWLSENPTIGSVAAGDTQQIQVSLDAGQVTQPGTYRAHLRFRENTPYATPDVQVIMHVPLPDDWGYLNGTVSGLARCDVNGSALKKATVSVDTGGVDYALQTDATGHYEVAFPVADGPVTITVSAAGYVTQIVSGVTIDHNAATTQDFVLRRDLPCLDVQPTLLEDTLNPGDSHTLQFTMTNSGAGIADFEILEGAGNTLSPQATRHNLQRERSTGAEKSLNARTTRGLNLRRTTVSSPYPNAAGDVIQSWSPGNSFSWGIAVDTETTDIWVDSPGIDWYGDDLMSAYQPDGTATGTSWPHSWGAYDGPADAAFNSNTGMLWIMDVGQDNCIHEIDPAAGVTGNTICPSWDYSQRGLAYDPQTDTYYAGGWNDYTIYHFDGTGAILDQTLVDLAIAGLAYNPDTQHLFVMVNDSPNAIHVLDAANGYADLGSITVSAFNDYDGAGMEMDCNGSLWAVNQGQNKVYQIDSGESTGICISDLPWLSENPATGTLAADTGTQTVDVTLDATQINQPGDYRGHLRIKTSYRVSDVQVIMHVPMPADWGILNGTVTGLALCNSPGGPIRKATVLVDTGTGTYSVQTDANGHYQVAYPADTPATVTASADGYIEESLLGVVVNTTAPTTADFTLPSAAPCLFHDDFDDGDFTTPLWTVTGPASAWNASSGDLVGRTDRKIEARSPDFASGGCTNCTITANVTVNTPGEKLYLRGWYTDPKNYVELLLNTVKGKVQLLQKKNGTTIAKGYSNVGLPTGDYTVQMSFDGTEFMVQLSGTQSTSFTLSTATPPHGTFLFRLKAVTGVVTATLKDITIF